MIPARWLPLFLILVTACSRPVATTSRLTIQIPGADRVRAQTALPANRQACYGVAISAGDIPKTSDGCGPSLGQTAGFTVAGGTIEASVTKGAKRKLDLYMYLPDAGATSCPTFTAPLSKDQLKRSYLVGSTVVDIFADVVTVEIDARWEGVGTDLAQGLPATCQPVAGEPGRPFSPNIGGGVATGTGVRLKATIDDHAVTKLAGPGIKMIVK